MCTIARLSTVTTLAVSVTAISLTACATSPIPHSNARTVHSSSVLAPDLLKERPGTGKITVKRDSGWMGSACTFRVFIDGRPVALLRNGERFDVFLAPGQHVLSSHPEGICGGSTAEVEALVALGQWKRYRID